MEMNNIWCTHCGISMRRAVKYVMGYNNQHYCPKQQVYNRLKRFSKWILENVQRSDVRSAMRIIMSYFSCYEFTWHCNKKLTKRIYFFAKPVMLKVCCKHLGICTDGLPSLKDIERETDQMEQLTRLKKTSAWDLVFQSKVKPDSPKVSKHTGK